MSTEGRDPPMRTSSWISQWNCYFRGCCCVSPSHVVLAAVAATKFKVCYNGQTKGQTIAGGGYDLRVGGAIAEVMEPDREK